MAKIERVEILQVDLAPKAVRTDAIQSFATQETPMVRIHTSDGIVGTGYAYTIGTGGSSVIGLLRDHLAPRLLGRDPLDIEAICRMLIPCPVSLLTQWWHRSCPGRAVVAHPPTRFNPIYRVFTAN